MADKIIKGEPVILFSGEHSDCNVSYELICQQDYAPKTDIPPKLTLICKITDKSNKAIAIIETNVCTSKVYHAA